jgi:hypothetical protein
MPGAQPRRPFETRMASTARRGALVPNGVPGVYRVPRRGRDSVVTQDPGLATSSDPVWVQPEDVETYTGITGIFRSQEDDGSSYLLFQSTVAGDTHADTIHNETTIRWESQYVILKPGNLNRDPVSPPPPPGMSVEYENPSGVLLTARIAARLLVQDYVGTDAEGGVYEIPESALDPGMAVGFTTGPSNHVSGAAVESWSTEGIYDFETPDQTFPESMLVGWRFATPYAATQTDPGFGNDMWVQVGDHADTPNGIKAIYTYRPPRYRFV